MVSVSTVIVIVMKSCYHSISIVITQKSGDVAVITGSVSVETIARTKAMA